MEELVSSVNFAKKAQQHDKFKNWFVETEEPRLTKFKPVPYRTKRYMKSPIPYLTNLLNEANWTNKQTNNVSGGL